MDIQLGNYYVGRGRDPDATEYITVDATRTLDGEIRVYQRPPASSEDIATAALVMFDQGLSAGVEEYTIINEDPVFRVIGWEHQCNHSDDEGSDCTGPDCTHECDCEQQVLAAYAPEVTS